jgi:hypothetical protein
MSCPGCEPLDGGFVCHAVRVHDDDDGRRMAFQMLASETEGVSLAATRQVEAFDYLDARVSRYTRGAIPTIVGNDQNPALTERCFLEGSQIGRQDRRFVMGGHDDYRVACEIRSRILSSQGTQTSENLYAETQCQNDEGRQQTPN